MAKPKLQRLKVRLGRGDGLRHYHFSKANLIVVALVVGGIGGYLLFTSFAATNTVGDANNDGSVNSADLSMVLANFGTTNASTDFNNDGKTNIVDLSIVLSHFGSSGGTGSSCQSVAIPAYSYPNPTTFWDAGIAAHPPVSIMIADPANGPGVAVDTNYAAVIARAKTAGVKVFGYVDTSYTAVSASTVNTNINNWKTMYGLNDIFFDQTSSGAGDLAYYQGIADHVHATSGAMTMFNPGVGTVEGYMGMADILNIFEGSQSDYLSFSMPSWTSKYPASRFSHLIYGVPDAANMTSVLTTSKSRHAGYVYITSDTLPNPWDQLPSYWTSEASQINAACGSGGGGGGGSSTSLYGVPWQSDGLANLEIGKAAGRQISIRFKAPKTTTLTAARFYLIYRATGYYAGNGGQVRVTLQTDSGGFPSGTVLATYNITNPMGLSANAAFPNATLNASLTGGQTYHIVFTNPASDPVNNYVSLDDLSGTTPQQADPNLVITWKYSSSDSWVVNTGHTPIVELTFADGSYYGQQYIDVRSSSGLQSIGGGTTATESFTPTQSYTIKNVHVLTRKNGNPSVLNLTLYENNSQAASASVAASSVSSSYGWVSAPMSYTLKSGASYKLTVSAGSGTYNMYPYQKGTGYGFHDSFPNGVASFGAGFDYPIYFSP